MSELKISRDNFESILKSEKPVLIDFYADWCGPCRMLASVIREVAEEADDVVVGKLNVDEEMELAEEFGVSTIPTLMVFKAGKPVMRSLGYIPKQQVLNLIRSEA